MARADPALRLLLAFAAFCAVLFEYRTINGVEAGSALLVVMIALKVLESNGHRDRLVLIMISYFLLFASLLTASGLLTAAYLLLLIWFTTIGLAAAQPPRSAARPAPDRRASPAGCCCNRCR